MLKKKDTIRMFHNKSAQSGRSMVEMLGVLAIIGVLSLMGVVGYKMAMTRIKANKLLDGSTKRAALVAIQSSQGHSSYSIEEFPDNETLGFTGAVDAGNNQFKLTITGIDPDICNQLRSFSGNNSIIQEIDSECSYFLYNNDLSRNSSVENNDTNSNRGPDGTCLAGWGGDDCDEVCDASKPIISVTGACYSCDSSEKIYTSESECDKCSERSYTSGVCLPPAAEITCDTGEFKVGSVCYPCSDPTAIMTSLFNPRTYRTVFDTEKCNECSEYREKYNSLFCSLKNCPENMPVRDYDGGCHSCDELKSFKMKTPADCSSLCSGMRQLKGTDQLCALANCPEGYYPSGTGGCQSCDEIYTGSKFTTFPGGEECLAKCGNKREVYNFTSGGTNYSYCLPKTCPVGYFKNSKDRGFGCISCSYNSSYMVDDPADCSVCDNTVSPRKIDESGECVLETTL